MDVLQKKSAKYLLYISLSLLLSGCLEENVAPVAENDSATLARGESAIINVLKNDSDANSDPLRVTNISTPEYGRVTLQADGSLLYQHDGSDSSQDQFTYTAFDGAVESEPAVVTLTIQPEEDPPVTDDDVTPSPTPENQPPIATNDQYQVNQGEQISMNLLQNDQDADGDSLKIVDLTDPQHGTLQLSNDGATVNYRHDGSDSDQDQFSYTLSDGTDQSQAQVTIHIATSNQPPQFTQSGQNRSITIDELYSLVFLATDPDGDDLTYDVTGLPYWLVYTAASRTITGSPSWEELGNQYPIVISASDGSATTENRFTLSVIQSQNVTDAMAHRLLLQATFGPKQSDIARVKSLGISGWIDSQLNMNSAYSSTSDGWKTHFERTQEITLQAEPGIDWYESDQIFNQQPHSSVVKDYQMAAWWESVLGATAPNRTQIGTDQLRQRVAYALSQLLVVSTSSPTMISRGESLAVYYDLLAKHAFGNYRQLLKEISISPAMGVYLSHQGNQKADPETGSRPDENFAREIIQLFTIGLYELNLDGSPNRDGNHTTYPDQGSDTVATYTQADIEELAKVMTGWDLADNRKFGFLKNYSGNYSVPMVFDASMHEDEAAEDGDGQITLMGQTLSLTAGADQSGLDSALDRLFAHPNIAPYVSKHLIQRLVTSNPSSNYVARIAQIFNDNGQGVKGDLKAVVRGILLDPEARDESYQSNPAYGKSKEPLLAITQLLRATHVTPLNGWSSREEIAMNHIYWYRNPEKFLNQAAMRSPSVFNFYSPGHVPSNPYFTSHQMVAPEFQIQTSQMLVDYNNLVVYLLSTLEKNKITRTSEKSLNEFASSRGHYSLSMLTNFDTELSLFEQALEGDSNGDFANLMEETLDDNGETPKSRAINTLIDHLDLQLLGHTMSSEYRDALKHYLLNSSYTKTSNNFESVRRIIQEAFTIITTSSAYMIQK
jgi:VCBS repeat-containing protein